MHIENLTDTQQRVIIVLERIIDICKQDTSDAEMFAEQFNTDEDAVLSVLEEHIDTSHHDAEYAVKLSGELETILEEIAMADGFGTERQIDPRGDGRDGDWSMDYVQGIDD